MIRILIYTRWKNSLLARSAESSLMQQCVRKQMCINNILKLPSTNKICRKNNFDVTGKAILPLVVNTDTVLVGF